MNDPSQTEGSAVTPGAISPASPPFAALENPTDEERNWSVAGHLVIFAGIVLPLSNFVGPFALLITKGQESEFIREHARESLNFQISTFLYMAAAALSILVGIGLVLLPLVVIFEVVMVLRAALAASRGETFQYPLCLRLVS